MFLVATIFQSVPFAEIAQINFSTPAQKQKRILMNDEADTSTSSDKPPPTI